MFISTRKPFFAGKLRLILLDILALCLSVYLATIIRIGWQDANYYISLKLLPLGFGIFIFLTLFYLHGLYELHLFDTYLKLISRVISAVLIGILAYTFIFYAVFTFAIGRGVFTLMALLIALFISFPRLFYISFAKKNIFGEKTIIVGTGEATLDIINLIDNHPACPYLINGIITEKEEADITVKFGRYQLLGSIDNIAQIAKENQIETLIVTTLEPKRSKILKHLRACRYHGVRIVDSVALHEEIEGRVPLRYIDDEWLFSSNMNYSNFHIKKLKRLMDIICSSVGIIFVFPLCLIVGILIKLDSPGPVFYRQKRLGRDGKLFRVIKFRSMIHRAERGLGGPVWSKDNDPRITHVGKWLRKTRIDEIPQLINVFLGQMSLVGPRPERPAFIKELSEKIPFYLERLYVQPGLTGWAQINYPYASTIEESKIKLQYDLYYIKHVSFFLDCLILLKTLRIVLLGRGR
jgi:exopolysaccharide biosynthesis polyprenyl glycosylphosphotransferase